MAKYRQIHVNFWLDGYVYTLKRTEKLFFLYLLTNSHTTQCGVYEINKPVISAEIGIKVSEIDEILNKLQSSNKVLIDGDEILLVNWNKYNFIKSPKVIGLIQTELKSIKSDKFRTIIETMITTGNYTVSIPYRYHTDTVPIPPAREEVEIEIEEEEEIEEETNTVGRKISKLEFTGKVLSYLNKAKGLSDSVGYSNIGCNSKWILNRLVESNYTLEDFYLVIDSKVREWLKDPERKKYLRPETLFGTKFQSYLVEARTKPTTTYPKSWDTLEECKGKFGGKQ